MLIYRVSYLNTLQATLEQLEGETRQINANQEALLRNFYELKELKHVLNSASTFFQEVWNSSYLDVNLSQSTEMWKIFVFSQNLESPMQHMQGLTDILKPTF